MKKQIAKNQNIKILDGKTKREAPKGKQAGLIFCDICNAVYYKKSWHHALGTELKKIKETAPIRFTQCIACAMITRGEFEGEIIIENSTEKIRTELLPLIKSFCKRAYEHDPMDRLIAIKKEGGVLRVTTTENQLAVRLTKKIKEVFKKGEVVTIHYSPKPSAVARIKIVFKGKE